MLPSIPQERFTTELFDILDETFQQVHGIYLDKAYHLGEIRQALCVLRQPAI